MVSKLEAENDGLADLSKSLTQQIEEFKPKLFELNDELKTKKADLKEIIKANEKEEAKLRKERKKIEEEFLNLILEKKIQRREENTND